MDDGFVFVGLSGVNRPLSVELALIKSCYRDLNSHQEHDVSQGHALLTR